MSDPNEKISDYLYEVDKGLEVIEFHASDVESALNDLTSEAYDLRETLARAQSLLDTAESTGPEVDLDWLERSLEQCYAEVAEAQREIYDCQNNPVGHVVEHTDAALQVLDTLANRLKGIVGQIAQ